ncbi:hypothetical protein ACFO5K_06910 [Nocardia halotolerans]|uniref:Transposase n=1 Tax=Nocardia halotolerans TaxID=1755878 RepID=A0ABV8VCX2_9NOCA
MTGLPTAAEVAGESGSAPNPAIDPAHVVVHRRTRTGEKQPTVWWPSAAS